jgi:hypothetical protein
MCDLSSQSPANQQTVDLDLPPSEVINDANRIADEYGLDRDQVHVVVARVWHAGRRPLLAEVVRLRATVESVEKLAADLDEGIARCEPLSILVSYTRGLCVARDQLVAALSGPLPKETAE